MVPVLFSERVELVSVSFVSVVLQGGKEAYFENIIQTLTWKVCLEKKLSKMMKKVGNSRKTKTEKQTQV